jgi:peptidyl-prolyl cis-trans isomerase A (cyclophilin A)
MQKKAIFHGFLQATASGPALIRPPELAGFTREPLAGLVTPLGTLWVALHYAAAPATVGNFLRYLNGGAYAGGEFHRTVKPDNQPQNEIKIGVIQGRKKAAFTDYAPIRLETTAETGLRHLHGTISMARTGPHTATNEFFLCVGDQPELDFGGRRNADGQGFAAFGRLVHGWVVMEKIQRAPAVAQALTPPVGIIAAGLSPSPNQNR